MITLIRTATALPGKSFELYALAKEAAALFERLAGLEISVSAAFGGHVGEVAWISKYDSLAQLEDVATKVLANAEWHAATKKYDGVVAPGSYRDQIWRSI